MLCVFSQCLFQSLDWVDVDFDPMVLDGPNSFYEFQSLDWVDVDFDPEKSHQLI